MTHRRASWVPSDRPFGGVRVLSFTHAIAGPTVGRVLAEQGADVLGATRPNDFEHDWVYFEANIGSRSAWLDLTKDSGKVRRRPAAPRRPRRGQQPPRPQTREARDRSPRACADPSRAGARLAHGLRVGRTMGPPRRLRHERLGGLRIDDDRRRRRHPSCRPPG